MSQTDKTRLREIWEERKNKVLAFENELSRLEKQLSTIDAKASASGVKSGALFSEYASYRRQLKKSVTAAEKKLAEARLDLMKAEERLKNSNV